MEHLDFIRNEVEKYLKNRDLKDLKDYLVQFNEIDIADIIDSFDSTTSLLIFRILPKDMAVEVFAELNMEKQTEMISSFSDVETREIIEELYFDDIIDLMEEVPANITEKILKYTNEEERKLVNQFLNYPQESAGSIMTIEYVELREDMTVRQALDHIKEVGLESQTIYTCYVLGPDRKLKGYIGLRNLVTANENEKVGNLYFEDVIKVHTLDDQEEVANVFSRYGFVALPVVDKEDRMVGIITVDDVLDIIEQETTEDMQIMAGTSPSEETYSQASVLQHAKNRLPWLLFLTISSIITGNIMYRYEEVLSTHTVLSAFIPMIMATGGNSGSQASTLVIRGLGTGDIQIGDGIKVLWKEFRISILVGLVLALVNFVRLKIYDQVDTVIALVVALTTIAIILIAKLIGGLLPIIAERLNLDPAIMAGPLITTAVDALALLIYFAIASQLLSI